MNVAPPGGDFREAFVEAGGYRVRLAEAGEGSPLVILPSSAGLLFSPGFDLLIDTYRVILVDPPGWGESPADEQSPALPDLARITASVLAAYGLDSYHLAGSSMGGTHALWLAAFYPERVRSLILDGSMSFRRDHWSMPGSDPSALLRAARAGADLSAMVPPAHPAKPWADLAYRTRMFEKILRVMDLVGPEFDTALVEALRGNDCPKLALFGAQDQFLFAGIAPVYEEVLANCRAVMVPEAGHDVPGEQPAVYAGLVRDFLAAASV